MSEEKYKLAGKIGILIAKSIAFSLVKKSSLKKDTSLILFLHFYPILLNNFNFLSVALWDIFHPA
jgi:hypothetical protein